MHKPSRSHGMTRKHKNEISSLVIRYISDATNVYLQALSTMAGTLQNFVKSWQGQLFGGNTEQEETVENLPPQYAEEVAPTYKYILLGSDQG